MMRHFAALLLGCALVPGIPAAAVAQGNVARLRVFLDCDCFEEFLRTEIRWVDFVRQREDADVHVLSSGEETGGGGREVVLRLVGLGRFTGVDQELRAITIAADTEDTQRRKLLDALMVGLLNLAAREGLPSDMTLRVSSSTPEAQSGPQQDPWNLWVFQVGANASFESEESSRQAAWEIDASADRVSDAWKIGIGLNIESENEEFDLDEDEPFEVERREREFDWFAAKSLGEHWSVGFDGDMRSSTFNNLKFEVGMAPAVEYNVFPDSQYVSRQLRIEYAIGFEHSRYIELTLFNKLEETLPAHEMSVTLDQRQPWGTLQAGVEWSQYLHDLSKSRLEVQGMLSFRVARGLSVEIEGTASRIRDLISLPRRDATSEEVLLRLRQLQSGHEVQLSVGVSYSFGSLFNNVVNPRFGR